MCGWVGVQVCVSVTTELRNYFKQKKIGSK
jgi:hypothetical protein